MILVETFLFFDANSTGPLWISGFLLGSLICPLQKWFCSFHLVAGWVIPTLCWRLQRCRLLAATFWSRASPWEHQPTTTVAVWAFGGAGLHHPQHWWAARGAPMLRARLLRIEGAWRSVGTRVCRNLLRMVIFCDLADQFSGLNFVQI